MTTATATPATPAAPTIQSKLMAVENTLNGLIFERRRESETGVTALVARAHHCSIGSPGIAKSMLVNLLSQLIGGARNFPWLMTRFTTPEEVFGPVSLKELENDHYIRNTTNKLPEADISFLDEIFKANSSILNALLTIMNEGVFYNNGTPSICRPIIFSASNELPREAELAALWDRVTFRHEVKGLKDNQSRKGMMVARYNSRLAQHTLAAVKLAPLVTWAEIQQAQIEAQQVTIPDSVFDAMLDLWSKLSKEGVEPTDRRFNDCIPIIQATAWREGCTVADVDHMKLLKHVLWTDIAHQPIVERLVLELANPLDKEAMDLMKTIDSLAGEVNTLINDTDNQQQRRRKGVEINGKLTRAGKDLDELFEKAKNSPRRSDMIQEARVRLGSIVQLMLKELFGITDPNAQP